MIGRIPLYARVTCEQSKANPRSRRPKRLLAKCRAFGNTPRLRHRQQSARVDTPPENADEEFTDLHLSYGPCDGAPPASASPQPPRDASRGKGSTATGYRGPRPAPRVETSVEAVDETGSIMSGAASRRLVSRFNAIPIMTPRSCAVRRHGERRGVWQTDRSSVWATVLAMNSAL